jgi:hypothetical protein
MSGLPQPPIAAQAARPSINMQRWLAFALLSIECGAIGYLSRTYFIPVAVVLIAFAPLVSRVRFQMTRQRSYDVLALVGIVYVLHYIFLPENPRYQNLFVTQLIAFNISLFSLTIQSLLFYMKRDNDFLPFMFPALGVVALACAAIVEVNLTERMVFQSMCVLFALVTSLFCDATRRNMTKGRSRRVGRPIVTTLALLLVGFVGWYTATFLHRYEHQMDRLVRRFLQPGTNNVVIGFSESARLGSISLQKDTNSNQVALRVVSSVRPGYLRGRAFDVYQGREWVMVAVGKSLPQLNHAPTQIESSPLMGNYFQVGQLQDQLNRFEVWPAFSGSYMAPLGCSYLHANSSLVTVDSHGIMRSESAAAGMPYSVYAQGSGPGRESTRVIDSARNERLTAVPFWARETPELQSLASRLFVGEQTTTQKIDAVKSFFRDNFRYSLRVSVPADYKEDPLKWFLLAKPAAHCEFFASGTALLLRIGGVRCRYVTGFVVEELNDFSGDWVARNKDAHAWVEAFDEDRGWIIVESTPSAGVPQAGRFSQRDQFGEYLKDRLQRLRMSWQQHGIRLLGRYFLAFVSHPAGAFVTFLIVVVLARRVYRHQATKKPKVKAKIQPADVVSLNKSLRGMEKQLKKLDESRAPGETLTQYADRLENASANSAGNLDAAASWIRRYVTLRFQRERPEAEIDQLSEQARTLVTQLRQNQA